MVYKTQIQSKCKQWLTVAVIYFVHHAASYLNANASSRQSSLKFEVESC